MNKLYTYAPTIGFATFFAIAIALFTWKVKAGLIFMGSWITSGFILYHLVLKKYQEQNK